MSNVIVVGLDAEPADAAALALAARLAELTGAARVAVALAGGVDADLTARRDASPARVLHDAARQLQARLIVVGSPAGGAVGRIATGSTAERLVQGSPCPV